MHTRTPAATRAATHLRHTSALPLPQRPQVCLTGANKANAAKLALETPVPAGEFPAQLVQPDAAPAVWLLDEAAAAKLDLVHGSPRGGMLQSDGSILYSFSD